MNNNKHIFLDKETYFEQVDVLSRDNAKHWLSKNERWEYHEKTVEVLKRLNTFSVLEAGTMGIKILSSSDTIDYDFPKGGWKLSYEPTYKHNLKNIKWTVRDKQYDVFIALRVFHHFHKNHKIYFDEMKRIAKHIILAFPESTAEIYDNIQNPDYRYKCKKTDTIILYWNMGG